MLLLDLVLFSLGLTYPITQYMDARFWRDDEDDEEYDYDEWTSRRWS